MDAYNFGNLLLPQIFENMPLIEDGWGYVIIFNYSNQAPWTIESLHQIH